MQRRRTRRRSSAAAHAPAESRPARVNATAEKPWWRGAAPWHLMALFAGLYGAVALACPDQSGTLGGMLTARPRLALGMAAFALPLWPWLLLPRRGTVAAQPWLWWLLLPALVTPLCAVALGLFGKDGGRLGALWSERLLALVGWNGAALLLAVLAVLTIYLSGLRLAHLQFLARAFSAFCVAAATACASALRRAFAALAAGLARCRTHEQGAHLPPADEDYPLPEEPPLAASRSRAPLAPSPPELRISLPEPPPVASAPALPAPKIADAPPPLEEAVIDPDEDLEDAPAPLPWQRPSLELLNQPDGTGLQIDREALTRQAALLTQKLLDHGVKGQVTDVRPGPVVTQFEFQPAAGVKVSRVANLADDLVLGLRAHSVRIVAPVPGRGVVGIELPNETRLPVCLRELLASTAYVQGTQRLPLALGLDSLGGPVVGDLAKMPHLLVAGSTGSGKSVGVNAMLLSLLYRYSPKELRLIMVDPKRLEFSVYDGIPHLLLPVVTEAKLAARALGWAVREMERRYELLSAKSVRSLDGYNSAVPDEERLPYLVIVVDELADLMMVAGREVEESIARLAQMARAAGIHLVLATQRPSVDVITGLIKANFPTRISFKVFSRVDSRTILDQMGAESLLGAGDMLYLPPGGSLMRAHGAFVSDEEVGRVVTHLRSQGEPRYDESILAEPPSEGGSGFDDEMDDPNWDKALDVAREAGCISVSMVQRRLRIGYNRAARLVERMEREGMVGPSDGAGKPRPLLHRPG